MTLNYETYYDKVLGGWLGKCAGGILGAPIEGIKAFNNIKLSKKLFEVNYPNDDLDLQLLWLDMVKQKGALVRGNDFAVHWLRHVEFPWNEYGIASRNLKQGIFPPQSGQHNNHYYAESMGCPIRSEIWGLLNPGNPGKAAFYAGIDASLDHYGFSVDAEKFLSACASIAFFETDITKIFKQALDVVNKNSTMFQLVQNVMQWQAHCGYKAAAGKIKSFYGDADFTSAPMNVGFTLLVLLDKGNGFGCVMDALHMGHDSDCIAATAGALVGIISGYRKIPQQWKDLVGNEVVVSKEIKGIEAPVTITGLAEQTCRAGLDFIRASKKIRLEGKWPGGYTTNAARYHLQSVIEDGVLKLQYENLSSGKQLVQLMPQSKDIKFSERKITFEVKGKSVFNYEIPVSLPAAIENTVKYTINIIIDSKKAGSVERGVAGYGSWLLAGPFIEDNKSRLSAYHKQYPEHGLSSLPSVQYMNHDKINTGKEFLTPDTIGRIMNAENRDSFPFHVQRIIPSDFRITPNRYYYGKGERCLYLLSYLHLDEDKKMWVSIGCSNPFTLSINNRRVHVQDKVERAWPGNSIILFPFKKGKNRLVIRLDGIIDDNRLEIGFKDFTGKHPHQEQWSLLVPAV